MVPLPVLDPPPDVMVIHVLLLTEFQPHVEPVVTVTLALPPPAAIDCDVGDVVYVHGGGGAENEN
jgi:hypothetical protein